MSHQKQVKQYAERDASELDDAGGYYIRHVCAMTKECLHSKADIAAELGFRDMQIDSLTKQRDELIEALGGLISVSLMSVSHDEYAAVFDAANNALAKATGLTK